MSEKIDFSLSRNELVAISSALEGNIDFINEYLDDSPLTSAERNKLLDCKKYSYSALRKVKKILDSSYK